MNFDSYIVQNTNISLTMPLACPPPRESSHSKGLRISRQAKKFGFTLAEVLITLTIIGVIAALTVPTLLMRHQKQTYVARLQKAYSQVSNALSLIPISQGCSGGDFDCAGWNDSTNIDGQDFNGDQNHKRLYLFSKQFKDSTICYTNCTSNFSPTANIDSFDSYSTLTLADGSMLLDASGINLIDINGPQGPNKHGRDIFSFYVDNNGKLYARDSEHVIYNNFDGDYSGCNTANVNSSSISHDGDARGICAEKILTSGKMDY